MNETWIRAVASVIAGFAAGSLLAWLARAALRRANRRPELRDIAAHVATFLFWLGVAGGIVLAVAAVEPRTIEDIPANILAYLPRVLAAGLILLAGRALAVAASAAIGRAVARALGRPSGEIDTAVRLAVNLAAVVLALSQLGVDTTVLVVVAGGVAISVGLSFALLVGLGGRQAAGEIAAGRYLRRFVIPGSTLRAPGQAGSVVALHPLTIELLTEDGRRIHVPHSQILGNGFEVEARDGRGGEAPARSE